MRDTAPPAIEPAPYCEVPALPPPEQEEIGAVRAPPYGAGDRLLK